MASSLQGTTISSLVVVVDPGHDLIATVREAVAARGCRVRCVPSFTEAKEVLSADAPRLLITAVRLGAYNGLHLVARARLRDPHVAAIVVDTHHDQVLEADALRLGAAYVVQPLVPTFVRELVGRLTEPGAARDLRRWARKPVSGAPRATISAVPATLLDVSYEGLRFEMRPAPSQIPTTFTVAVPGFDGIVAGRLVWLRHAHLSGTVWAGATLAGLNAPIADRWRIFVDGLK